MVFGSVEPVYYTLKTGPTDPYITQGLINVSQHHSFMLKSTLVNPCVTRVHVITFNNLSSLGWYFCCFRQAMYAVLLFLRKCNHHLAFYCTLYSTV